MLLNNPDPIDSRQAVVEPKDCVSGLSSALPGGPWGEKKAFEYPILHQQALQLRRAWLNQVERWFGTLTQKYIRRGTHRSTRQLEQAIRHYIKINNDDPKPFVWSKTADDILASVERFCLRTSNSRH